MEDKCFMVGCNKVPNSSCSCTESLTYVCSKHIGKHNKEQGVHNYQSLLTKLGDSETLEFLEDAKEKLLYCDQIKKSVIRFTSDLMNFISASSKKVLSDVQELESKISQVYIRSVSRKSLNKKNYQKVIEKISTPAEKLLKNICDFVSQSQLLHSNSVREDDKVLFFARDSKTSGILSIDLESFETSRLDLVPNFPRACQACYIGPETYFINGGIRKGAIADTFSMNLKQNTVEVFPNSSSRCSGAAIMKKSKVYIFGGSTNGKTPLKSCEAFNLVMKNWEEIASLPSESWGNTASLIGSKIIIAGYNLDFAYVYDDNQYSSVLALESEKFKVVCEQWIVTSSVLYESQNSDCDNWIQYQVQWEDTDLYIGTTFKRGFFIYFLDVDDGLMRLDTQNKKLDRIDY